MSLKLGSLGFWKKVLLVAMGTLIVFTIGGYVYTSLKVWHRLSLDEQLRYTSIQEQLVEIMNEDMTMQQRLAAIKALRNSEGNACIVHGVFAWQRKLAPGASAQIDTCKQVAAQLKTLWDSTERLEVFLQDEQRLSAVLAGIASKNTLSEADWQKVAQQIQGVAQKLRGLEVSDEYTAVRNEAIKRVDTIARAWGQLIAAHNQQDRVAFTSVSKALTVAYADLGRVTRVSDEKLGNILKAINSSLLV